MNEEIAVIGCGLMGSAIARGFAAGNQQVVVWNRTPQKTVDLEGPSIRSASSPEEAVASAGLAVLSLSTYAVAREALESVADWSGTTVANLITGTPEEAETFGEWITRRGGRYLDGAILAYPQDIGSADATILVAGGADVWAAQEDRFRLIAGASRHVSDRSSAANVLDVAATGAFYTVALAAFVEAAAFAQASNVAPDTLLVVAEPLVDVLRRSLHEATEAIQADRHETDQATLDVYLEAAEGWRAAMVAAGQRASLLGAAITNMRLAQDASLGHLGFFAQSKTAHLAAPDR
jgi:3-hydroxyisobutyrate dehydrogenase-like beta-hydroxyacid dehydrogenase